MTPSSTTIDPALNMPHLAVSLCLGLLGLVLTASDAAGQSAATPTRVWHQPPPLPASDSEWLPQPILQSSGEVIAFAGDTLRLQSEQTAEGEEGDVTSLAAERILWIEPAWNDATAPKGMAEFAAGRYDQAIPLLLEAIRNRPPVWQQQWLTGHMAIAAAETGRYPAALEVVGQLARSRPPTPMLCLLPIRWTSRPLDASAVAAARASVDAAEPAVRLVAASWMLGSAADRATAERVLQGLRADDAHPWIARLAEAVQWRRTPVPQIEAASAVWQEKIDQLPIALQGGPLLCAADRLAAAGFAERAAEFYWSAALLHQHPRTIADEARASLQAGSVGSQSEE